MITTAQTISSDGRRHSALNRQFRRTEIPLPPLPEQQRIVAILDEAFAGIATATANAEKNLENARELFESYLESVFTQEARGGWRRIGESAH